MLLVALNLCHLGIAAVAAASHPSPDARAQSVRPSSSWLQADLAKAHICPCLFANSLQFVACTGAPSLHATHNTSPGGSRWSE